MQFKPRQCIPFSIKPLSAELMISARHGPSCTSVNIYQIREHVILSYASEQLLLSRTATDAEWLKLCVSDCVFACGFVLAFMCGPCESNYVCVSVCVCVCVWVCVCVFQGCEGELQSHLYC